MLQVFLHCAADRPHTIYPQQPGECLVWKMPTSSFSLTVSTPPPPPKGWVCFQCLLAYRDTHGLVFHTPRLVLWVQTTCPKVESLRVLFGGLRRGVAVDVLPLLTWYVCGFPYQLKCSSRPIKYCRGTALSKFPDECALLLKASDPTSHPLQVTIKTNILAELKHQAPN